jgi:hypothetical protein
LTELKSKAIRHKLIIHLVCNLLLSILLPPAELKETLCVFRKRLIAQAGLLVKQRRLSVVSLFSAFSAVQDFVRERLRGSAANWESYAEGIFS